MCELCCKALLFDGGIFHRDTLLLCDNPSSEHFKIYDYSTINKIVLDGTIVSFYLTYDQMMRIIDDFRIDNADRINAIRLKEVIRCTCDYCHTFKDFTPLIDTCFNEIIDYLTPVINANIAFCEKRINRCNFLWYYYLRFLIDVDSHGDFTHRHTTFIPKEEDGDNDSDLFFPRNDHNDTSDEESEVDQNDFQYFNEENNNKEKVQARLLSLNTQYQKSYSSISNYAISVTTFSQKFHPILEIVISFNILLFCLYLFLSKAKVEKHIKQLKVNKAEHSVLKSKQKAKNRGTCQKPLIHYQECSLKAIETFSSIVQLSTENLQDILKNGLDKSQIDSETQFGQICEKKSGLTSVFRSDKDYQNHVINTLCLSYLNSLLPSVHFYSYYTLYYFDLQHGSLFMQLVLISINKHAFLIPMLKTELHSCMVLFQIRIKIGFLISNFYQNCFQVCWFSDQIDKDLYCSCCTCLSVLLTLSLFYLCYLLSFKTIKVCLVKLIDTLVSCWSFLQIILGFLQDRNGHD